MRVNCAECGHFVSIHTSAGCCGCKLVADPNGPGTKTVMCLCKRNQLEAGQAAVEASRGTKERQ